ncbi:hypothetical protein O6H91_04G070700 [Diphasiastrum complanatum]|uniref:Uncharacterized protein n=1 Tax=Diphasiastrum complanatum TaxID=34168 RepID=A0ACC2DY77_DIPCM|nr:hypothetical protein O6H91_04G070700 [Diphasiastrum complanatum]
MEEKAFAQQRKVAVVGGGLAGLAAARALSSHPTLFDVVILEAAPALGGRVKHINGIAPWPVEIGPEFLHGKVNSSIKQIADEMGCKQRELSYPDHYYIGSECRLLKSEKALENPEIQHVHEIFSGLAEEVPPNPDVNMKEYMLSKGFTHIGLQLAQSIYGNDFGCSLEHLGVRECIQEAQHWTYGDTYVILDRPLSCLIEHLASGLSVILDSAVETIDYSGQNCTLKIRDGRHFIVDYVILTVSVKMLQQRVIDFVPPLPNEKEKAVNAIGMSNALKVILAFSHCFWPIDMFDVVCTDSFLPEVWATEYPTAHGKDKHMSPLGQHVLVGFITGDSATAVSLLPPGEIFIQSLCQLDAMFGKDGMIMQEHNLAIDLSKKAQFRTKSHGNVDCPNPSQRYFTRGCLFESDTLRPQDCTESPASYYFQGGCVINWADEVYIGGGYSHPSFNAHGARSTLAEPVLEKLYFAGEATHPGVNPCMQGAIDTGVRAADEIITAESRKQNNSKL